MAVAWNLMAWVAGMIWIGFTSWVVSCLTIADEIASSLRTGDIGPFPIG
ncbi:uncharacterized protein LOC127264173 [Andrographis paniculata]|nr:uncharacterized protein LOC127264173 [Andrographis paniculata]